MLYSLSCYYKRDSAVFLAVWYPVHTDPHGDDIDAHTKTIYVDSLKRGRLYAWKPGGLTVIFRVPVGYGKHLNKRERQINK